MNNNEDKDISEIEVTKKINQAEAAKRLLEQKKQTQLQASGKQKHQASGNQKMKSQNTKKINNQKKRMGV